MSYRDTAESLRARRDRLAADLEEARKAAAEARERADRARELESELAETEALLSKLGARTSLPMLEDVRIAAPCSASWDDMTGDDRVRFCGKCEKNVYNLSAMPRAEAERLLQEKEGRMCVRLYKRADGTVLTADCPVGVSRRRRRLVAMAAVGSGMMAAATAAYASVATMGKPALPETHPVVMGGATFEPTMGKPTSEPYMSVTGSAVVASPPPPAAPPGYHVMGRMRSR